LSDSPSTPPSSPAGEPARPKRPKTTALERAQRDLQNGRPDQARARITGYLYTLARAGEYKEAPYLLLGEACWAMQDRAAAGAAWLLTTKEGPDVSAAVEAFHARYGKDPANVLHALKPRAQSESYPLPVQERLKSWGYRYRPYRPRSNPHVLSEQSEAPTKSLRSIDMGCLLFVLVFVLTVVAVLSYLFQGRLF